MKFAQLKIYFVEFAKMKNNLLVNEPQYLPLKLKEKQPTVQNKRSNTSRSLFLIKNRALFFFRFIVNRNPFVGLKASVECFGTDFGTDFSQPSSGKRIS